MDKDSIYILMLAAGRYAGSRSKADRAVMLSVGNDYWQDFPVFLTEMKQAFETGHSREFLSQDNVKHLYALLFVSILNGLDNAYLNKVGNALLAAAEDARDRPSNRTRSASRNNRTLATPRTLAVPRA